MSAAAVSGLPPERFGVGSAVNQAVRQLGAVFGVALVIAVLATATPAAPLQAFEPVFWLLIAGGVLTSLVSLQVQAEPAAFAQPISPAPKGIHNER